MTIECYFSKCEHHATREGDEGPFCHEAECRRTEVEIRLLKRGYDLEELDKDSPYNFEGV